MSAFPLSSSRALFKNNRVTVVDGGMGTELGKCLDLEKLHPHLWSTGALLGDATRQLVANVHASFIAAGAQMIVTATYQLSSQSLAESAPPEKYNSVAAVVELAIQTAKNARANNKNSGGSNATVMIAGSIGPIGSTIAGGKEYTGDYSSIGIGDQNLDESASAKMAAYHAERLTALLSSPDVDCILLETMPRLDEVLVVLQLVAAAADGKKPVVVSFMTNENGIETAHGENLQSAYRFIVERFPFVCAVGVNCRSTATCSTVFEKSFLPCFAVWRELATSSIASVPPVAFWLNPNSGERYVEGKWVAAAAAADEKEEDNVSVASPASSSLVAWFAGSILMKHLVSEKDLRVMIGGCCRTAPNDIAALCALVADAEL